MTLNLTPEAPKPRPPTDAERKTALAFRNVFTSPGADIVLGTLKLVLCSDDLYYAIAENARAGRAVDPTMLTVREGMRAGYATILHWLRLADRIEELDRKAEQ